MFTETFKPLYERGGSVLNHYKSMMVSLSGEKSVWFEKFANFQQYFGVPSIA